MTLNNLSPHMEPKLCSKYKYASKTIWINVRPGRHQLLILTLTLTLLPNSMH